jgi:N,N'-diacetyllegionaminate synthase
VTGPGSTMPSASLSIQGRPIGPGHPCFVIAEAGVNHNGDPALARKLVDAAAAAGADAVKFQTFQPDRLVADNAPKATYQLRNDGSQRSQREMLEALVLSPALHRELAERASSRGLLFLSSPFDEESAEFLDSLGVPAFKIPSGEVTNHGLLAQVARKRRPLLVSTGMCDLAEVAGAVEVIRANGASALALFHCVSNYPCEPREANLRAMNTLRSSFGVPVGWSDHTLGIEVALAAVALGADLLEKHLTLDQRLPGPDHRASLEPQEFSSLVRGVRAVQAALGTGLKVPTAAERDVARVARKSLHWRTSVSPGTVVAAEHLIALRPGWGVPPSRLSLVVGRTLSRAVREGALLREEDLEKAR